MRGSHRRPVSARSKRLGGMPLVTSSIGIFYLTWHLSAYTHITDRAQLQEACFMTPNARDKPVGRSHSRSRQLPLRHHNPGSLVQIMWRRVIGTFEHTNGMHAGPAPGPLSITLVEGDFKGRLLRSGRFFRQLMLSGLAPRRREWVGIAKRDGPSKGTAMHRSWMMADRLGRRKPHRCTGPTWR